MKFIIREIEKGDFLVWSNLWKKYLDFYETKLPKQIFKNSFDRMLDPNEKNLYGFLAVLNNEPVGLAHIVLHDHNWKIEKAVYLQDLYVLSNFRKKGIGKKLINSVYEFADNNKLSYVYWLTQDFNIEARSLYNKVGKVTPFIKYNRF